VYVLFSPVVCSVCPSSRSPLGIIYFITRCLDVVCLVKTLFSYNKTKSSGLPLKTHITHMTTAKWTSEDKHCAQALEFYAAELCPPQSPNDWARWPLLLSIYLFYRYSFIYIIWLTRLLSHYIDNKFYNKTKIKDTTNWWRVKNRNKNDNFVCQVRKYWFSY